MRGSKSLVLRQFLKSQKFSLLYCRGRAIVKKNSIETRAVLLALAAIAQESRLGIFRLFVQIGAGGLAASTIAKQISIARSSVSFHLKELTHAKMLTSRNCRFVIYSADPLVMHDLSGYPTLRCCAEVAGAPAPTPLT